LHNLSPTIQIAEISHTGRLFLLYHNLHCGWLSWDSHYLRFSTFISIPQFFPLNEFVSSEPVTQGHLHISQCELLVLLSVYEASTQFLSYGQSSFWYSLHPHRIPNSLSSIKSNLISKYSLNFPCNPSFKYPRYYLWCMYDGHCNMQLLASSLRQSLSSFVHIVGQLCH